MSVIAAAIVAYSLFDAMPSARPTPAPSVHAASEGKGQLSVFFAASDAAPSAPRGAVRVRLGTLHLSASCEATVSLRSLTLRHTGLGSVQDIRAVYLADGFRRVSRAARFDASSGEARLQLFGTTIAACDAVSFGVFADLSDDAAAAGEHGIEISSAGDIESTAATTTLSFEQTTQRTVSLPSRRGSLTVRFLPIASTLRYGSNETVARLQLSADAVHGHALESITLTNEGLARDMDLQNFRIETRQGLVLSGPALRMNGRRVTIPIPKRFIVPASSSVVLLVKADIRASMRRDVRLILQEPSDLVAIPVYPR